MTKQTILARVTFVMIDIISRIGITETLYLKPQKEGSQLQLMKPLPQNFFHRPLESSIGSEEVGGTWYPQAPSVSDIASEIVVLSLHGGAFIQGDGSVNMGQSNEEYSDIIVQGEAIGRWLCHLIYMYRQIGHT
ncbi:hypothetical protein F5B20DRAFT_426350 [Whalleya microplaca]|nr:hypothetical protein F5B20DRAFT_426350 [Whalleya microplaca]